MSNDDDDDDDDDDDEEMSEGAKGGTGVGFWKWG
jgi:hypothetical protein